MILVNVGFLASYSYGQSVSWRHILNIIDCCFTSLYVLEVLLKWQAAGNIWSALFCSLYPNWACACMLYQAKYTSQTCWDFPCKQIEKFCIQRAATCCVYSHFVVKNRPGMQELDFAVECV